MNPLDYETPEKPTGANAQRLERWVFASAILSCPLFHWPAAGLSLYALPIPLERFVVLLAVLLPRAAMFAFILFATCRRRVLKRPWSELLEVATLFTGISLLLDLTLLLFIYQ